METIRLCRKSPIILVQDIFTSHCRTVWHSFCFFVTLASTLLIRA